jgi:hypothetical protein
MDQRDKILSTLRMQGPSLPVQIVKAVGGNTIFVGAYLSELSQAKKVKISKAKIGSSPLYYIPGQESRIGTLLYKHLHDKEKLAYDHLKSNQILRDKDQTPVMRVTLREIKDFSEPMEVTLKGVQEIFWKWHLVTDEEATKLIRTVLGLDKPKPEDQIEKYEIEPIKEEPKEQVAPRRNESVEKEAAPEEKKSIKEEKLEPKRIKEYKTESKKVETIKDKTTPIKEKIKIKEYKATQEEIKKPVKEFIDKTIEDRLITKVKKYFNENNIKIKDINVIRKNSEIDFIIELPSNVGMLTYFCKAKSKKKCNDGDLSSAYISGQMKKLPILFLTVGDITKKADNMLKSEFKSMIVKNIA